ncbi:MAG: hypothetical protein FJ091_01060 [Deltaproteobacteria bacterium]|nr:hypothetical protein [Deltaproteobacteria bacterium]
MKHPLLERAQSAEVRNAKGFKAVAAAMTGESVAADWAAERDGAPRRAESGRKHLVAANKKLAAERKPARDSEHLALALVTRASEGGAALELPEGGAFTALHAGAVLKSAQPDPAAGTEDSNWGAEPIDLLGVGADGRITVAVVRWLAPSATRVQTGDTPLRALLDGLAWTAGVEANRESLTAELAEKTSTAISAAPPALLLIGSYRWWELSRKREAQKGAAWIKELERLAREIGAKLDIPIRYLTLRTPGDPGFSHDTGAPRLDGDPRFEPAFELGADKVRPKAAPSARKKKAAGPAAPVKIEADLSRPVRSYVSSEHFAAGDRVQHAALGLGVVQGSAGLGKVRIQFESREAVLVHDRRA